MAHAIREIPIELFRKDENRQLIVGYSPSTKACPQENRVKKRKIDIGEMAWGFQAHVGNCCFELLGFKHKKINFSMFPTF